MSVEQVKIEPMMPAHLDGALDLSNQAQWPHRREDWELVESVSQGIVAIGEDRVRATIMMTPYGDDAATINMVIVDEALRGRGIGRTMMEQALARAGERTCYLVATPEGLPLYEKLGFVPTGKIVQHQGEARPTDAPARVTWSETGDFDRLVALDRAASGHDRSALMRVLRDRAKFCIIRDDGEIQAFGAIRLSGCDLVIGPVAARNLAEAEALIGFLLAHHRGRFVRVDTDASTGLAPWLAGRGLSRVGGGIAMMRSGARQPDTPRVHRIYALVSQALG